MAEVATDAGICHASYVTLKAGVPASPVVLQGCGPSTLAAPDGILQAASLTKPIIAFVALELVRAGKLDLRSPVSAYLPEGYIHRQRPFDGPSDLHVDRVLPATLANIPMASLLNHSSGLPNWSSDALAPTFTAGQRWQYSGEAYLLLQAIITAVTGQPIEATVSRVVFEPLGMRDSRMRLTDDIRARVVTGVDWLGRDKHFEFIEPNAAASMYTTAGDYAKFLAALASRRDLLALITADPIAVDRDLGLSWGYGWGIEQAEGGPYLWQWGNNPGYRAFAMLSVASGHGFILMTNSENGLKLAPSLAQSTVPATHGVFRFDMLG
ncbi:serine hydrolase domain-containing protein [Pigmentiphaga aceris]|uniref:serine hydrolase domain-containing protein n=1 Tax=Pigmentiphaga aceris TaxID=1940612 RepID=UPI001651E561|nr:serine hydrolase domain-containing protein [Pigmentiphaga aceris]